MEEERVPKLGKDAEKKRINSWKLLEVKFIYLLVDILVTRSADEGKC